MAKTQVILKGTMRKDKDGYHVSADVVQPAGLKVRGGYGLGNRKSLAERAVRAIDAGTQDFVSKSHDRGSTLNT